MLIKILKTFTKNISCNIYKPISTISMEAIGRKVLICSYISRNLLKTKSIFKISLKGDMSISRALKSMEDVLVSMISDL